MRLLDRYVLRNFLQAYFYCIAAFIAVWLIFDISDNISTFLDDRVSLALVAGYYLTEIPLILVVLLPVSLLLALLFSLGRMSRSNEVVSMLTAGVSVPRLLTPLIGMGILTALTSAALNFALAPHAEQARRSYFESAKDDPRERNSGQVFRNRAENRTWFIQRFRPERNQFLTVQVLQQDDDDNIIRNYSAAQASYRNDLHAWELKSVKIVNYDHAGEITDEHTEETLLVPNWSETPFRLASTNMRADYLSVPELRHYLRLNWDFPPALRAPFATHFQYRLALPWECLVVVFLAAPLAISFSRSGVLSAVAGAIGLVFSMNFLRHLFLALGEGDRVAPFIAAWTPNILFAAIGAFLLYARSTNRDLSSSLNPFAARRLRP